MNFKHQIFTALLMLFVIIGQTMVAQSVIGCDMDMHQMNAPQVEMSHDSADMSKNIMDCCTDDATCAMYCSFAMVSIITEFASMDDFHSVAQKTSVLSDPTFTQSLSSLFRPPISS